MFLLAFLLALPWVPCQSITPPYVRAIVFATEFVFYCCDRVHTRHAHPCLRGGYVWLLLKLTLVSATMAPSSGVLPIPPGADALEWMYQQGLTDGLPVVVPTRGKVRKMLSGTSRVGTQILGKMPPSYNDVSVEHVAIAAVMAGCEPKHFCVVVAGAEAFLAEAYGLHSTLSTTQGASQFLVVNGPARERCGINFQHGVLGSGHRANATICRALKLLLDNTGTKGMRWHPNPCLSVGW